MSDLILIHKKTGRLVEFLDERESVIIRVADDSILYISYEEFEKNYEILGVLWKINTKDLQSISSRKTNT